VGGRVSASPHDALPAALGWLSSRQAAMETLLAELVEISSHTADPAGCDRVADRYIEAVIALGRGTLDVVRVPGERHGGHLSIASRSPGSRVLLVGHHDTVFPTATFAGFREDGPLIRGPGVLDMKGGLVVIAYALGALAEAGLVDHVPLEVISVSDEEVGSPEGRRLILDRAPSASCALVFESGREADRIITRRKGTGGLTVTAHGKAAHAGNLHHEGKNAIWALARFVDRAQEVTDYDRGVTVNVGRVEGGIGRNTVPDRATAWVDFRFVTSDEGRATDQLLRKAAAAAAESVRGTQLEVHGGIQRAPLERTAASAALYREYAQAAAQESLGTDEAPLLGGGSDANTVAELGVPAIDGLGPRGRGFHTVDEHVERSSLVPKAAALVRFLAGRAR
jgi:glutamate carboxypeptidase